MGWTTGKPPRARVLVAVAVLLLALGAAAIALAANDGSRRRAGAASEPIASTPAGAAPTTTGSTAPPPIDAGSSSAAGSTPGQGAVTPAGASSTTAAVTGTTRAETVRPPTTTTLLVVALPADASGAPGPLDLAAGCGRPADTGYAAQLAGSFTAYRAGRGLPAMGRSAALDAVALDWARTLACAGAGLSHNPDLQSAVLGACGACRGWAENVAADTAGADHLWQAWLASTPHRDNIEDAHGGVFGMAVVRSASGSYYGVQDFGRYP
jgi:uncharacterized protein YkwD